MTLYEWHDPVYDTTLVSPGEMEIRLKLPKPGARVQVVYWNKYRQDKYGMGRQPMVQWAQSEQYGYYRTLLTGFESRLRYLQYAFEIEEEGGTTWYNAEGACSSFGNKGSFSYSYAGDRDGVHAPDWIHDRVWYQIFPERFCNGDSSNDPAGSEPWGSEPTRDNYMGGDLQGIIKKLDYIGGLGVNALYLNPIFTASSNHKYDTVNYREIDPQFGTKDDLRQLVEECHKRDIKVVLDLVINHCGYYHPFFRDVMEKGEASEYKDWFYIHQYPVELSEDRYDSVGYYQYMPKLRTSNPQVRQYVLDTVHFWQKETGIDGWRIDVADEVELSFLRELNAKVKECDPNSFIIAEIWYDAKRLLQPGGINTVMNYELRTVLLDCLADRSASSEELHERLLGLLHRYSLKELHQMYNLLGSHDTERILTRCKGDADCLSRLLALQFVLPGTPAVYYGDELGLLGENDPGCRAAMPWDPEEQEQPLTKRYKQWIHRKTTDPVLQKGDIRLYAPGDGIYIIKRVLEQRELALVLNLSAESKDMKALLSRSELPFAIVAVDGVKLCQPSDRLEPGGCLIVQNYDEGAFL